MNDFSGPQGTKPSSLEAPQWEATTERPPIQPPTGIQQITSQGLVTWPAASLWQANDMAHDATRRGIQLYVEWPSLPLVNAENAASYAHDLANHYYLIKNDDVTGWSFDKWSRPQIASFYEYLRSKYSTNETPIAPLVQTVGPKPLPKPWVASYISSSKKIATKVLKDLTKYQELFRLAQLQPVRFRYLSEYPFDTATWLEIARDIARAREVISSLS